MAHLHDVQVEAQRLGRPVRSCLRAYPGLAGFLKRRRASAGGPPLRNSSRFPPSSVCRELTPVMFPPAGQAGDDPSATGSPARHHDRDRVRRVLGRADRAGLRCHKHVDREPDQLGREVGEPFVLSLRLAVLHDEVLAFDVAELAQPLSERLLIGSLSGRARREPIRCTSLLRVSGERRRKEAQGEGDDAPDGAAPHVVSSGQPHADLRLSMEAERWASGAPGSGSEADAVRRHLHVLVRCVGLRKQYHNATMHRVRARACLRLPSTLRALKPLGKGEDLFPYSFRHEAALCEGVRQGEASEHEQDECLRITP